ncbi:acyltransferase family protein [Carboxylicivirga sp. N1Y90]|uniref:acyltransferase family protein n=1 Tax=Carboxylicivirga fragile TaxID=3417571 RepID=UPI003D353EF0|nr:acyltransferase [Marinilabiliaceae bacterium N1Y90]
MKKFISIILPLRGLAALMVVLFHLFCLSNNYFTNETLLSIFRFGKYGIHIFFIISGFVITYSLIDTKYTLNNVLQFFKKRIVRIEPPYILTLLLCIVYSILREFTPFYNGTSTIPDIWQVMLHLGYLIPFSGYPWINIVFWTLAIEFQFYLLFAIIYPLFRKKPLIRIITYTGFISLHFFSPINDSNVLYYSPLFLVGIILALHINNIIKRDEFIFTCITIATFTIYFLGLTIFLFQIFTSLIILFQPGIKSRLFNFLGKISYSLYLIHTLIVFFIINIAHKLPSSIGAKVFVTIIAITATIGISYLQYIFVEKPFIKLSKRIKYK